MPTDIPPGAALRPASARSRRIARAAAVALVLAGAPAPASVPLATSRTVDDLRSVGAWDLHISHPLRLEGTLTFVDRERHLFVLQDATGAVALEARGEKVAIPTGHAISVEVGDSLPRLDGLPGFPYASDAREYWSALEAPTSQGTNYVSRLRGYLYPPVTGQYRFYIASDDSSELWLGTDEFPSSARLAASVPLWTRKHEWQLYPSQQSVPLTLEAGRRYFLEIFHEQQGRFENLSVAWDGPGLPRQVIEGRYLGPYVETDTDGGAAAENPPPAAKTPAPRGHILREYWSGHSVENIAAVTAARSFDAVLTLPHPRLIDLGPGTAVAARAVRPGQKWERRENFSWVEIEGDVEFVAREGDGLTLELVEAQAHTRIVIQHWRDATLPRLDGRRVRLAGVGESGVGPAGEPVLAVVWVPQADTIPLLESAPHAQSYRLATVGELIAADASRFYDRPVRVRGRIVGSQTGGEILLSDFGSFQAYVSRDGAAWEPQGNPVEVPMGAAVEAGLAVNSRSPDGSATAYFDHVTGLSDLATGTMVGNADENGKNVHAGDSYTITGKGNDIWNLPDQFYFVHHRMEGPGEISARLVRFDTAEPWAKAGLMVRGSLAPDAAFADFVHIGAHGGSFEWRRAAQGSAPQALTDVALNPPYWLKLVRRFNTIPVVIEDWAPASMGRAVEITGYLGNTNGRPAIVDAHSRKLDEVVKPAAGDPRPLVALADVYGASGNADHYDILKARGVVTFFGQVHGTRYLALQDQSGSAFIVASPHTPLPTVVPGQFVELQSDPGANNASPYLPAERLLILGRGTLPKPLRHPQEYALPRRGEATWVEVEGIVRRAAGGRLQVKAQGELIDVALGQGGDDPHLPPVDALVRVRGAIAFPSEDERLLLVPSPGNFELVEPPATAPFALPIEPVNSLTPARLLNRSLHRVRISGVVTARAPGFFYVQDATGGARIELAPADGWQVGDGIEVVGFPDLSADHTPALDDPLVKAVAPPGPAPEPPSVRVDDLRDPANRGRLVRLAGTVADEQPGDPAHALNLQAGRTVLRVFLPAGVGTIPAVPAGSEVMVRGVGVSDLRAGRVGEAGPAGVQLLLRSPGDLVVLQKPRWWVVKRALLAVVGIGVALLVSLVWVQRLRRRVAQRTAELQVAMEKLRRETQTAATLAERNRLAGEIHDSLEQGFSGLILHLDTINKQAQGIAPELAASLALARNMATFSRTEVRHAVLDLQAPVLENSDLGTALRQLAAQLGPEAPRVEVAIEGPPRPLGSPCEHHLLRVAQEAIANAVKHAAATAVKVTLRFTDDAVDLIIADNGRGFEPAAVLHNGIGHFGLRSLRGRANQIHGKLTVQSRPGAGAVIAMRVPRSPVPSTL